MGVLLFTQESEKKGLTFVLSDKHFPFWLNDIWDLNYVSFVFEMITHFTDYAFVGLFP